MKLAHISDTHLGYEAYRAMSAGGENQRGVDIARAFVRCVDDICEWDPPLVVHSGDLAEKPHIPIRLMLLARAQLEKLASIRPDGTRRQVVIIAGNHDQPASRKEACYLELFRGMPGVHIVTTGYQIVRFDEVADAPGELAGVEAHCLPHDTLKDFAVEQRFDEVTPTPGKQSILVAHGVAGGSGLYKRVVGREFTIPTDVLVRDWAYGALGHWHRQGPVSVASAAGVCWYAGSSENIGFGDLLDNGTQRGYLRVETRVGQHPVVSPRNLPIRTMTRLGAIDGAGKTPEEIGNEIRQRLETARGDKTLTGAIVGQHITGVTRDIWGLVDVTPLRELAMSWAMHYEITVVPVARDDADTPETPGLSGGADVISAVRRKAAELLDERQRAGALSVAERLLERHLGAQATDEDTTDAPAQTAGGDTTDTNDTTATDTTTEETV